MDKELVNNQIILMRKMVRSVKRSVYQKMLKQIKVLQKKQNKQNVKSNDKLEKKISNKQKELIAIKGVNVDEVSKQALIHNKTHFEEVIRSNQTNCELKAIARIANNFNIEKAVNKFKDQNPNCDEWIPSQIELWQQKKLIKRNKINQKKGLNSDENIEIMDKIVSNSEKDLNPNNSVSKISKIPKLKSKKIFNKIDSKTNNERNIKNNEMNDKPIDSNTHTHKPIDSNSEVIVSSDNSNFKITKNLKLRTKVEKIKKQLNSSNKKDANYLRNKKNEEIVENKVEKPNETKSDSFFLSNDTNVIEEQMEESIDQNPKPMKSIIKLKPKNLKQINEKKLKNESKLNLSAKDHNKDRNQNNSNENTASSESLHPSWAAKRSIKNKYRIDLNRKPLSKKIKFE